MDNKLDCAALNAALADAEKSISQARGAMGNRNTIEAAERLTHAKAIIDRQLKALTKGESMSATVDHALKAVTRGQA
jgi:flagellin-specific chaperone FliS